MNDVVSFKGAQVSIGPILADTTSFMRCAELTDDHRRTRLRRIDAGDVSVVLKFTPTSIAPTDPIKKN